MTLEINMQNPKIWVLGDHRPGNTNQAIAVAERMNEGYELKIIKYNFLSRLPNFLFGIKPLHIDHQLLHTLEHEELPAIIISSGRRTAPLARYLKRKSGNKIKLIQIMRPDLFHKEFDLIILPQHDKTLYESPNIVRILGALNNVKSKLTRGQEELRQNYPELDKFVAVIIGGNTKNYTFTTANALQLASLLSFIAGSGSLQLFISFSRRTQEATKKILANNLPSSAIIYDPTISDKPNPYLGMLACSSYIIVTCDSISMCSEAASTGVPLYVFCPTNFQSKKHLSFFKCLQKLGIARILDESSGMLEDYHYTPLDEVKKVVEQIKRLCSQ